MNGNLNIYRVVVMIIAMIVNLNETLKPGCHHRRRLSKGLRASLGSFWYINITTMKMPFCKKSFFHAFKDGKHTYILFCVWFGRQSRWKYFLKVYFVSQGLGQISMDVVKRR